MGDNCPPNMGGVVFGCPALPPPVPENSTGNLIYLSAFPNKPDYFIFQRLTVSTPPMILASVVDAINKSSSMRNVTRPSIALQVPWQMERKAAPSNAMMDR